MNLHTGERLSKNALLYFKSLTTIFSNAVSHDQKIRTPSSSILPAMIRFNRTHLPYIWCFILLAIASPPAPVRAQTSPQHPNILLINADDLGVDMTNGYQNNAVMPITPTLDSLQAAGVQFMNAWSTPVCTSTRAALMSAKYGVKTGVTGAPGNLDTSDISVFSELAALGNNLYAGAVIGKWHISLPTDYNHPQQHGIDYYEGVFEASVSDYYNWTKVSNGVTSTETTYATTYFTDQAISWVNAQTSPWFLWLAEVAPHSPFHTPPAGLYSIASTSTNQEKYIASIEAMDAEIGRLLANVSPAVLANTIIIYIGDNGTPGNLNYNYPQGHGKGSLYQGGVHVPMTVCGAGVSRINQQEEAMVFVSDIYATILEATGIPLDGGLYNGLSFHHLLSATGGVTRDYNYSEIISQNVEGWTIRQERYKLIEFADGTQEFYDLDNDPFETNDLIGSLTTAQDSIKLDLEQEAQAIRNGWSCRDHIKNGDEFRIDCGGTLCEPCAFNSSEEITNSTDLRLFPNPSKELLRVESATVNIQKVTVTTLAGKTLLEMDNLNRNSLSLDLSAIPNQVVLVQVHLGEQILHRKVVVR